MDGDGRDLSPLWRQAAAGAAPGTAPPAAFAELTPWWMWRAAQGHFVSVRTERFKLIREMQSGITHLYDLDADPGEKRNVAASEAERVTELAQRIDAYLATRREPAPRVELSPEKVEQLRALGYVP
jgi:arylsulfatase A-like enzyme